MTYNKSQCTGAWIRKNREVDSNANSITYYVILHGWNHLCETRFFLCMKWLDTH